MNTSVRLPDFVVIGAAKSGTTSLYGILLEHAHIYMPDVKEPEFFARDEHYEEGIESYAAQFEAARADQIIGEGSTIYSLSPFFPETAARLAHHRPDAKIIYIMRQPVERAYSFYVQIIKNYQNITGDLKVHRTFEEFINTDLHAAAAPRQKVFSKANDHLPDTPELCLAGSDYPMQIKSWLAHFRREQILFLTFEDFVEHRSKTVAKITDFIGVDRLSDSVFDRSGSTRNVAATHFKRKGQQRALNQLKGRVGALWMLRKLMPSGLRSGLKARLATGEHIDQSHIPPEMAPETRAKLTDRFRAHQTELKALTGLDTSHWWT